MMATSVKPLRRANVTRVTTAGVYVTIPTISPNAEIGPMDAVSTGLVVGDRVIVGQAGNEQESWVVITKLADSPIGIPTPFIYSFATVADRDDIFDGVPANMVSPTFAWVEDVMALFVWTTTDDAWHQVSWDEERVSAIETDVGLLFGETTALDGRVDNLEAFAVTDSSTIDFTLSGVGAKTLTGVVKANSITLDDLSGVVISSPATAHTVRYNGTSWVNSTLTLDDLAGVVVSGSAAGHTLVHNGSNYVNVTPGIEGLYNVDMTGVVDGSSLVWDGPGNKFVITPRGPVDSGTVPSGSGALSSGTEVAVPAASWTSSHEVDMTFKNGWTYRVQFETATLAGAASQTQGTIRIRKGSATITGQILCFWTLNVENTFAVGNSGLLQGYIKNASGADITTKLSVSVIRVGSSNTFSIGGELFLAVYAEGPTTTALGRLATAIV